MSSILARSFGVAVLAILFAAAPARAQRLDRAGVTASVDSLVADLRTNARVPGISVVIAQGSQPILAKGYGVANLDHDVPAGPETVYAIMSITKQFVGAAIAKLASEGKLSLDDDVAKYLPGLPMLRGPVTLRQLLHHTSGIPSFGRYPGRGASRLDSSRDEWLAAVREMYKDRPAEFSPGDVWAYRDVNYALLGFVVEKISGRTLWEYFAQEFFTPLGMTSTAKFDPTVVTKHRATAYVRNDTARFGMSPAGFYTHTLLFGNNGLASSAMDLLRWQRALVEDRVPGVRYPLMTEPGRLSDGRATDYGFGVVNWALGSQRMVFHTGGGLGFNSFFAYLPGNDATVAIMTNANADILKIGAELARIAAGLPQVRRLAVSRAELARYAGTYAAGSVRAVVRDNAGVLEANVSGSDSFRFIFPVRLLKQSESDFVVEWEPESRAAFRVAGDRASALVLRFGGRSLELARTSSPTR